VTAILVQRLLRRTCAHCREDYAPTPREVRALGLSREELHAYPLARGRGCARCFQTGYRGRIGVFELLLMTDPLRDAILQRRPSHELRRLAIDAPGFVHLQEDGLVKAVRGETTFAEVLESTPRLQTTRPLPALMESYD
jgi:type IV pilus assembly protein PilB